MSQKAISMLIIRTMLQLLQRSGSERSIAEELNMSRNTLRKNDAAFKASPYSYKELLAMDDTTLSEIVYPGTRPVTDDDAPLKDPRLEAFEALRDHFLKELKRTGVTKQLLWQEYLVQHPDGFRYTQFCERLRRYEQSTDVSLHIAYKPGDTLMIDFAGDKLSYVDPCTGELFLCPVLVCVLPFSGYSYVEALPNATLPQLVKALNNCLRFMGGAPLNLLSDNMRQVVTKSCRYEPVFTNMILAWAQHNSIHLKTARVRSPRDKPHVENEVKITYARIYAPLRDKVYHSLDELNSAILRLLKRHHKQPFQKREQNRLDVFTTTEQLLLQSLPPQPYAMKYATESKVQRNYHVILGEDRHFYSVPYTLIGKKLRIVYDTDTVEIFQDYQRVAIHKRSFKRYDYTTNPAHMPDAHKSYHEQMGWDKEYFLKQAVKIGAYTIQYMQRMIDSRQHKEQAFLGCVGILRLASSNPPERVEAACRLALQSSSTSYKTIANILLNKRDLLLTEVQPTLFKLPPHDNLRGSDAYN